MTEKKLPVPIRRAIDDLIREAVLAEREACAKTAESLGAYGGNNADIVIAGMIRDRSKHD